MIFERVTSTDLCSQARHCKVSSSSKSRLLLIGEGLQMLLSSAPVVGEEETLPHVYLDRLTEDSALSRTAFTSQQTKKKDVVTYAYSHFRVESPLRRMLVDQYARHVSWRWSDTARWALRTGWIRFLKMRWR